MRTLKIAAIITLLALWGICANGKNKQCQAASQNSNSEQINYYCNY